MASSVQIYRSAQTHYGEYYTSYGGVLPDNAWLVNAIAYSRHATVNDAFAGTICAKPASTALDNRYCVFSGDVKWKDYAGLAVCGWSSSYIYPYQAIAKTSSAVLDITPTNAASSGKINDPKQMIALVVNGELVMYGNIATGTAANNGKMIRRKESGYNDRFYRTQIWVGRDQDDLEIVVVFGTPFYVEFDANGGAGTMDRKVCYYGASSHYDNNLRECSFDRTFYNFAGWNTKADGTGTAIADKADASTLYVNKLVRTTATRKGQGDSTSITATIGSITLYAQWTAIPAHRISLAASPEGIGVPATIGTSPARTEDDKDYYDDEADVVVTPVAFDGYRLESVMFYDMANPSVSIGSKTFGDGEASAFTLSASARNKRDILLRFNYAKITYSVTAAVDTASKDKVSASVNTATASWGDTVTFSATEVANGYSFAGWYDADGNLVSDDAEYQCTAYGDISLVAKCKVSVTVSVEHGEAGANETCSLVIDGVNRGTFAEFDVVLGDSFAYTLSLGMRTEDERWCLDKWTLDGEAALLPVSGTYAPAKATSMTAEVKAKENVVRTLTVSTWHVAASGSTPSQTGVDGEPYAAEGDYVPSSAQSVSLLDASSPGEFVFKFYGAQYVRLVADASVTFTDGGDPGVFKGFYDADGGKLTDEPEIVVLLTGDREVRAYYGFAGNVTLKITYADDESTARGSIWIASLKDASGTIAVDGLSAELLQGTEATLLAVPKNGYEFKGWYRGSFTDGDPVSAKAKHEFAVMSATTLYAAFAKARNSICEWEGSSESKTLEWTSKTYVTPRPFDPVAARVDAAGYPVDLTVRTFSSPDKTDALPVRDHKLTWDNPLAVRSQDGRRLPRMRPERYVQISLRSAHEVDAVAIGTNMAEVN